MEPNQRRVLEFHRAFGLTAPEKFTALRDPELLKLRARLILEEALEFCAAAGLGVSLRRWEYDAASIRNVDDLQISYLGSSIDDVMMIDALADLKYVADGAAVCMGVDMEHFDIEVHFSNMSKSKIENGKATKGQRYKRADIEGILFARYLKR